MKKITQIMGVAGFIIITTIAIAVFSTTPEFEANMKPSIQDDSYLTDQLLLNTTNSDNVQISESVEILKGPNYIIDENGNKQYILVVTDSPILDDQN